MRSIQDVNITDKRLLIRVDFNVPLDAYQNISDDTRIRSVLPTLKYALDHRAKLIIASHLGRPKGRPVAEMSLAPVAKRLGRLLEQDVSMAPDCVGDEVADMVASMKPADILLLENLRFHEAEQKNDDDFAGQLAALCDVYVNDAFAVSHRANASVAAVTRFAPVSVAGFLLQKELAYFEQAMTDPKRPLVAIVGGAKVSSKLGALKNMLNKVDKFIIGGAMANTFLKARGHGVGQSLVEEDLVDTAGEIMADAASRGIKFYLPVDAVVASRMDADADVRRVPIQEIPQEWMALDVGPATTLLYEEALSDAKTVVWNGPMGVFEMAPFSKGTVDMVHIVANADAMSIVGGGDTDVAIHQSGEADRFTYISTGGGAFLCLLEGKTLPAVDALKKAARS